MLFLVANTQNIGRTTIHTIILLSENADTTCALAKEDLDSWPAEKAWLRHQAD